MSDDANEDSFSIESDDLSMSSGSSGGSAEEEMPKLIQVGQHFSRLKEIKKTKQEKPSSAIREGKYEDDKQAWCKGELQLVGTKKKSIIK